MRWKGRWGACRCFDKQLQKTTCLSAFSISKHFLGLLASILLDLKSLRSSTLNPQARMSLKLVAARFVRQMIRMKGRPEHWNLFQGVHAAIVSQTKQFCFWAPNAAFVTARKTLTKPRFADVVMLKNSFPRESHPSLMYITVYICILYKCFLSDNIVSSVAAEDAPVPVLEHTRVSTSEFALRSENRKAEKIMKTGWRNRQTEVTASDTTHTYGYSKQLQATNSACRTSFHIF